jgi:hypothetical protein
MNYLRIFSTFAWIAMGNITRITTSSRIDVRSFDGVPNGKNQRILGETWSKQPKNNCARRQDLIRYRWRLAEANHEWETQDQ